jgi:hypothetical protein
MQGENLKTSLRCCSDVGSALVQISKMARNAFTAAEDTVQYYAHVCSILQHLEFVFPNLQILGLESPSHSYN